MSNLVRAQQAGMQPLAISRQLAEHMEQMHISTEVAKNAIEEISEVYMYSEFKAINSLVAADMYRKAYERSGGTLSPAEAHAYIALRQQYLEQMATITAIATSQIVQDVVDAPRDSKR